MTLPAYLDTHAAIVGSSGAGKTVTAKRQVEQLLDDGRQVAILDPTGAWYGLRTNADNSGRGFDIPIFGGAHADVAIDAGDGAAVAGAILDQRVSAVVDLSELHEAEQQRRFAAAFVARLRAKPPGHFNFVVDEADEFCPQTAADSEGYRLLQDMVWIAKRGRLRGFVLTTITQRPADISKAVLSQMQTIIAHQLVAPQDQAAIDAYLKANGDKQVREEVMASLPGLARGERWIYSPRLGLLERGVTPPIATWDSSATPAPGEERAEPRRWSEIDASAIRAALVAARPEIADATATRTADPEELAVKDVEIARLRVEVDQLRAMGDALFSRGVVVGLARGAEALTALAQREAEDAARPPVDADTLAALERHLKSIAPVSAIVHGAVASADHLADGGKMVAASPPQRPRASTSAAGADDRLNATAIAVGGLLKTLDPDGVSWDDAMLLCGRRPGSGDAGKARAALLGQQLVNSLDGRLYASDALAARADIVPTKRPAPVDLVRLWADKLRGPGGDILLDLAANGPATRAVIGGRIGKAHTSGWFGKGVKDLVRSNLVRDRAGRLDLHPFLSEEPS